MNGIIIVLSLTVVNILNILLEGHPFYLAPLQSETYGFLGKTGSQKNLEEDSLWYPILTKLVFGIVDCDQCCFCMVLTMAFDSSREKTAMVKVSGLRKIEL